jgi:hypothetical protein
MAGVVHGSTAIRARLAATDQHVGEYHSVKAGAPAARLLEHLDALDALDALVAGCR